MADSMNDLFAQAQAAEAADVQTAKEFVGARDTQREQEGYQSTIDQQRQQTVGSAQAPQVQSDYDQKWFADRAAERAWEPRWAQVIGEYQDNVTHQLGSIPYQVWGGLTRGASNILAAIDSGHAKDWRQAGDNLTPSIGADALAGKVTGGVSQFALAYLPASRALSLAGAGATVATVGGSFVAGAADFSPEDKRISDLIQAHPSLANSVTGYLASQPGDTEWDARLKNGLEQSVLGEVGELGLKALSPVVSYVQSILKSSRAAGAIADTVRAAEETKPTPVPPSEPIEAQPEPAPAANETTPAEGEKAPAAPPKEEPWVPEQVKADTANPTSNVKKSASPQDLLPEQPAPGEAPSTVFQPHTLAADMMSIPKENTAEVLKAIQEGRFNDVPAMLDDTHRTIPWDKLSDGANLKGVLNAVEDNIGGLIKEAHGSGIVGDAQIRQLAADIGGDVGSLQRLYGQVTSEGGLAARITAGYNMLTASARQLKELAMNVKNLDLASEAGAKASLEFHKQLNLHSAIQGEVRQSSAEIGRALYAHRALKASTDVSLQNLMDYGSTKLGPKALKDLASQVANAKDLGAIGNAADQVSGKGFLNVLREIANNGMLSSPVTQMTNVIGNTLKVAVTMAERYVAGGIGTVRGVLMPSAETAGLREAVAHTAGAYTGFKQAFGLAWQSLKDENFTSKFSQPMQQAIYRSTDGRAGLDLTFSQIINAVGKVVRFPGRIMGLSDHFTQAIGYNADLNARAYVQAAKEADAQGLQDAARTQFVSKRMDEIVKAPTRELDESAMAAGRYTAYLEPAQTFMGDIVNKAFQNHPMVKLVIAPFTHRPGNILRQSVGDYTIAGLAQQEIRGQLAVGGTTADLAMARMFLGTGALATGLGLAEKGLIVGQGLGSKNTEGLDGVPAYSANIGGAWHKFDRMDPVGMWMGLAADLHQAYVHSYDPYDPDATEALQKATGAAVMSLSRNMMEKSFMKSLDDLMSAMSEKEPVRAQELATKLVAENVAKLVPFSGLNRSIERATDTVARSSGRNSLFDGVVATIPGMGQELPPRRDLLGRTLPPTSWWNPFNSTQGNTDQMDQELSRLAVGVNPPPRQIDGYQLNPKEWDQVMQTATQTPLVGGKNLEGFLRDMTASQMWEDNKRSPDGGQLRNGMIVQQAMDSAYQYAKDLYKLQHPELAQKKQQEQVAKFMASVNQQ